MTREKTTLIQKDHLPKKDPSPQKKGTILNSYKLIIFLPMMRKILTTQIREEMYDSLE